MAVFFWGFRKFLTSGKGRTLTRTGRILLLVVDGWGQCWLRPQASQGRRVMPPESRCPGSRRRSWEYRTVCQLGHRRRRPVRLQVPFGRRSIRQSRFPRSCTQASSAASLSSAATSCRFGRRIRRPRISRPFTILDRLPDGRMQLCGPGGRRHLSRREPYPGNLPLEFPHQFASLSALVSGRRRAHLHHPQVSARLNWFPQGTPGGTSVWNFSPQGGIGVHYFIRPKRSIDLGVNAVHISSASLGDKNPGVNASIQIQVGYTYWK